MKIKIEAHTLKRAIERGATKEEIIEVLKNGESIPAKSNRFAKHKVFTFNKERNGKYYKQKRIEVYYIIENVFLITVTVYVYYGKWEE